MKKLCDSCQYYADKFGFCRVKYIKVGKNLVNYCKEYKKRGRMKYEI